MVLKKITKSKRLLYEMLLVLKQFTSLAGQKFSAGRIWPADRTLPNIAIEQCFPTFFVSRHPYLVLIGFGGTPRWSNRYNDQGIVIFGCTPGSSSRHPSVLRHPGWESLL